MSLLWLQVDLPENAIAPHGAFAALFAEELGLVLEVHPDHEAEVRSTYEAQGLSAVAIGSTSADKGVSISVGGEPTIQGDASTALLHLLHVPSRPMVKERHCEKHVAWVAMQTQQGTY